LKLIEAASTANSSRENRYLKGGDVFPQLISQDEWLAKRNQTVNSIAIFLLATLRGATQYGEREPSGHGSDYFWDRVEAAKYTYGRHTSHFYAVVGKGDPEKRILLERKLCKDHTPRYHEMIRGNGPIDYSFEIHMCGTVHVLLLPHCDGSSWGFQGPCCRCEGAMRFFLNMHRAHSLMRMKRPHLISFPDWFTFADDDYYIRPYMLEKILNDSAVRPSEPYALVTSSNLPEVWVGTKDHVTYRPGFGGKLYSKSCSATCVHRIPVRTIHSTITRFIYFQHSSAFIC
jgi:hypothetical protein